MFSVEIKILKYYVGLCDDGRARTEDNFIIVMAGPSFMGKKCSSSGRRWQVI